MTRSEAGGCGWQEAATPTTNTQEQCARQGGYHNSVPSIILCPQPVELIKHCQSAPCQGCRGRLNPAISSLMCFSVVTFQHAYIQRQKQSCWSQRTSFFILLLICLTSCLLSRLDAALTRPLPPPPAAASAPPSFSAAAAAGLAAEGLALACSPAVPVALLLLSGLMEIARMSAA